MKKTRLFTAALRLVWSASPFWASANVVVSVLRSILPLGLLLLIKILIDSVSSLAGSGTTDISAILYLVIAVVAVFFVDEITSELSGYIRKKQSVFLESYMYGLLHTKAVNLDLINFENPAYFDILSRASREATWRPGSILNNIVSFFRGILSLALMAGLLFSLNWWIVLLLLAVNIPAVWLRLYFADVLYNFHRVQTPEARKSAYFNWLLTGDRPSREIRLFGLGGYFRSLFTKSFRKQKDEEISIIRKRTFIEMISTLFKAAALFIVLWYLAGKTVAGTLTIGQMAMFILAFRQGMLYLKETFGSLASLYEDSLFIGDTFEFLDLREHMSESGKTDEPGDLEHGIEADHISFTYPGCSTPAIKDVSFSIKKGEVVAIVGNNGSGKSTLVRLLCRLYDADNGVIRFDGRDIRSLNAEKYRKKFSVVFQDFMLFNLTAGENIWVGNNDSQYDEGKIKSYAGATGFDEIVKTLPDGYNTPIGNLFDNSRELSWGEWQKIAVSRALFREAPVIIMDEPSSALDAGTEHDLFSRLRGILSGKTAIIVSHRFSGVRLADRIIVLDNGIIKETGTHAELLAKNGTYSEMFRKQAIVTDEQGA